MTNNELTVIRKWIGASEDWLRALLADIKPISSIVCVVAMGSTVRERVHRRSDLDLLILFRGRRPTLKPPLEVDVRMYPVESVADRLASGHEVLGWAMRFGVALYDPERVWDSLRRRFADRVPLPSADDARSRAKQSLTRAREMLSIGDDSAADDLVLAGATQLVRARLIENRVFPASRPELPAQLAEICPDDPFAQVLEDAMYGDDGPAELLHRIDAMSGADATSV